LHKANERGIRVTGSELVGLIPLKAMLDAGKYFLRKQQRSTGVSEKELIKIAIKSMGLDELGPFNPDERIIEYLLKDKAASKLVSMSLGVCRRNRERKPCTGRWFDIGLYGCIGRVAGYHGG
jgi:glutamate formiminotransferase/formiminotetrahydrofolate cyclodeaminase